MKTIEEMYGKNTFSVDDRKKFTIFNRRVQNESKPDIKMRAEKAVPDPRNFNI